MEGNYHTTGKSAGERRNGADTLTHSRRQQRSGQSGLADWSLVSSCWTSATILNTLIYSLRSKYSARHSSPPPPTLKNTLSLRLWENDSGVLGDKNTFHSVCTQSTQKPFSLCLCSKLLDTIVIIRICQTLVH